MRLLYDSKQVGTITTNHSISIDEACSMCGIDINEDNNGDAVWNCELFSLDNMDEKLLNLTHTESKITDLIKNEGLTNRQLAERLGIAEGTIRTHMSRILIKLNIKSRTELKEL